MIDRCKLLVLVVMIMNADTHTSFGLRLRQTGLVGSRLMVFWHA